MYGSGTTTLIISNKNLNDMIKLVKALEDSHVLTKEVSEVMKKLKGGFLSTMLPMLLGTLGSSLIGNLLTGEGLYRTGYGTGKGMYRTGYGLKKIIDASTSFNKF